MAGSELRGLRVLVTRPARRAQALCQLIEAAGGEAVSYPVLELEAPHEAGRARAALARIAEYDWVVFVSGNAVDFGLALLGGTVPPEVAVAVVGKGTAAALERHGRVPDVVPAAGGDSEALLARPELAALHGRKVLIVRGEGGRELLAETLRRRGAAVDYAEVYRRSVPAVDPALDPTAVDVVTATSSEALANLERLAGPERRQRLHRLPLAVFHARIADKARAAGFRGPILVAGEPGDEALIAAIAAWARNQPAGSTTR